MNLNDPLLDGNSSKATAGSAARHPVLLLSSLYLEAGLPLEAAVRSALADYECGLVNSDTALS